METMMNRILIVTDEDETLVLEYLDLEDLKNEKIIPGLPSLPFVN